MKHQHPCSKQDVFIDFHETRNPFSAFCHDLDMWEEKSNGAGDKIWGGEDRKFPPKCQFFSQKSKYPKTINSIYTSFTQEPRVILPYINHTSLLKFFSTLYQIHHPALNYGLDLWVRLHFPWWTEVSSLWQEQTQSKKTTDTFVTSMMKSFQGRHKPDISLLELNVLLRI